MSQRNALKLVHFASTMWFAVSAACLLIFALLKAGKNWWVIVSLSGYSTPILFVLLSLYSFAIFRGVARSQKTKAEHPLTASIYYIVFYDVSPFLGALVGVFGTIRDYNVTQYLLVTAISSLWVTFLVWIIVDPLAGLIEMLLPSSRQHRRNRMEQARIARKKEQLERGRLLAEIKASEEMDRAYWGKALLPYAEKIAELIAGGEIAGESVETEIVDIGVYAWQMGELGCMRQLHSMAMEIYKRKCEKEIVVDYVSIWWDGIGSWQSQGLEETINLVSKEQGSLCAGQ